MLPGLVGRLMSSPGPCWAFLCLQPVTDEKHMVSQRSALQGLCEQHAPLYCGKMYPEAVWLEACSSQCVMFANACLDKMHFVPLAATTRCSWRRCDLMEGAKQRNVML